MIAGITSSIRSTSCQTDSSSVTVLSSAALGIGLASCALISITEDGDGITGAISSGQTLDAIVIETDRT